MGIACLAESVGFHTDHLDHLTAAGDQFGQCLTVGVGKGARFGTDPFGEQGNNLGVERIGLGQPTHGAGEIADLAWVDHGKRQTGAGQGGSNRDLETPGGLQHDEGRVQGQEIVDELLEAFAIAHHGKGLT